MRGKIAILILALLCAVQSRAQQTQSTLWVWANTNESLYPQSWTNALTGNPTTLLNGLATNVYAPSNTITNIIVVTNSTATNISITNLNLGYQQNVSFFAQFTSWTNTGNTTVGSQSNLVMQFAISPDYTFWQQCGLASNALWITDPTYVMSVPVWSNNALVQTGWTNSGWTNFSTKGFQAIELWTTLNSHTNLLVSNLWIEPYFK